MDATLLSSEYISKHPYFTARRDAYKTSSGKVVDPYFLVELPPCVVVFPVTHEGGILMVNQYRHPVGEALWELPGGFIDQGETALQAAEREMMEETGYSFSEYHHLGSSCANPGVLTNTTQFFIALNGKRTGTQQLDANEEILIREFSAAQVKVMLMQHEIRQSLHALCLFYGFNWLEQHNPLPGLL